MTFSFFQLIFPSAGDFSGGIFGVKNATDLGVKSSMEMPKTGPQSSMETPKTGPPSAKDELVERQSRRKQVNKSTSFCSKKALDGALVVLNGVADPAMQNKKQAHGHSLGP